MNELSWWAYPLVFLASAVLSWVLVPLAIRVAVRHDIVDRPGGYKVQESPVPYLGGIAILVAFCLVVLGAAFVRPPISGFGELAVMLGGAAALGLMGLVDDLRGLGPFLRLMILLAVGLGLVSTGVTVRLVDGGGPVDAVITLVWIIGVTNSFNLLDNMDGLSAGVATISALSVALIAGLNGQFLVGALASALAGCASGFLRHNVHPARVYMGDAGSIFLGFILSVLALKLRFDAPRQVTAFVPLVIFALPMLDTTLVVVSRLRNGRNIFAGGRDHISHRLVRLGLSVPHAVRTLYAFTFLCGWIALITSRVDQVTAYLALGFVGVASLGFGVVLGRVPVYEAAHLPPAEEDPEGDPEPAPPLSETSQR